MDRGTILIVDDNEDILVAGKLLLARHFDQVESCNKPENIIALMQQKPIDVILLDMNFGPGESSGDQGMQWLDKILAEDSQAVVIMITAHGSLQRAVDTIKNGATDFIVKPWQNEKLVATVSAGVKLRQSRCETAILKDTNRTLSRISSEPEQLMLGKSAAMAEVNSLIERAAPRDINVLILGENGTGKELVARQLHRLSPRASAVFMSVDMGALTETLFESELFGHKKGAFTGANSDRIGRFHAAQGGTLFLDEIGNIPLTLQSKLLTALERREVAPVGGNIPKPFDVRVIAATNLAKEKLEDNNYFRQDLLFRLNTIEINLPPLRDRADDTEEIALYYSAVYARKYAKPEKHFSPEALDLMRAYSWPGNIRSLRHTIERSIILSEGSFIEAQDLQLTKPTEAIVPAAKDKPLLNLAEVERALVLKALQKHSYNISHSAKALGLTRAALYRRMEKYGL